MSEIEDHRREIERAKERVEEDREDLERLHEEERRIEHRLEHDREELEELKSEHVIVINAEQKEVHGNRVSFSEAIRLAFPNAQHGPNVSYTVTFRKSGERDRPEGSLVEGGSVRIKDGTRFDVTPTDKS